ncbi:NADP-dependent oxidoreductase [Pelagibaculum spongiae]|uniref:NADP-dependent oxidoreductase n=1 Tax=Pelagibaculum spongiae TaxID=2080658 RepID=A0A2V1GZC5_9GAMM|nr:NADP-dependent oxidoreductase [Pelagibaculum spongiae]PVZ70304.1 NADP-dependent oxidoreductase [Pelagibaculum spongiae]
MQSQEFHLTSYPQGKPSPNNFRLCTKELPPLKQGQLLIENQWLSVDPYMRSRMVKTAAASPNNLIGAGAIAPFSLNQPMEGGAIGKVIESQHTDFQVGDLVNSFHGWRNAFVSDGRGLHRLPESNLPTQSYLGAAGLSGLTAWAGLYWIGGLREGETVLISAASGAVGSMACQLAKLHGCTVIATVGSDDKVQWLEQELGVDKAINYKDTINLGAALTDACENGIDVCFENVGGDHLQAAINLMNRHGRIVLCGLLSQYNSETPAAGPNNLNQLINKSLRMEGFVASDFWHMYPQYITELNQWKARDEIQWQETIVEGLENAPQAFIDLFDGKNIGKMLIKI